MIKWQIRYAGLSTCRGATALQLTLLSTDVHSSEIASVMDM